MEYQRVEILHHGNNSSAPHRAFLPSWFSITESSTLNLFYVIDIWLESIGRLFVLGFPNMGHHSYMTLEPRDRVVCGESPWLRCIAWWRHEMETFSALLGLCARNSPVTGEFPSQRPVTQSFEIIFDLGLNQRWSKQSWGWWLENPPRSLLRHCNGETVLWGLHGIP